MSKSDALENDLLLHILQNADIADIGDAAGLQNSATAGSLYVSLHEGDPGEAGTQETNETAYEGYTRQAVVRSSSGWTVSGNAASNAAVIEFPVCTADPATITHFGVGTASSGAGKLLYKGTASLAVGVGITPSFAIGALDLTED